MDDGKGLMLGDGVDVAEYCRRVEEHLARVNAGHLVRVVGPAFTLVRSWAEAGVPFSVVCRGIDRKAQRHQKGRSTRPLRLEFCEADVRDEYEQWRRAVGLVSTSAPEAVAESEPASPAEERRRPSAGRVLDRAIEKLVRATADLDASEDFRTETAAILDRLVAAREGLRHARGEARASLVASLDTMHRALVEIARRLAGRLLAEVEAEAEADLAPYRSRLAADVWRQSVEASVDRLLLERMGLPSLGADAVAGAVEST